MGFLKNMTIKSTAKKRATHLRVLLDQCAGDKREILKEVIENAPRTVWYQDDATWCVIFCYIVWESVCYELSYDPAMGNNEDKILCFATCIGLLHEWYPIETKREFSKVNAPSSSTNTKNRQFPTITTPVKTEISNIPCGGPNNNVEEYNVIEACLEEVKKNPESAAAWYTLGEIYHNSRYHRKAIDAFHHVLTIAPKDVSTWYFIGLNYSALERYNDAIEAYRKALILDPRHKNAENVWMSLGVACDELKRYNESIEAFRQAIIINPKNAKAWLCLSIDYSKANLTNEASDAYRRAISIDPNCAP